MKIIKIVEGYLEGDVDWNKPQWVQCVDDPAMIILTTGDHRENEFTGTCLPCERWNVGLHSDSFMKDDFLPLEEELDITISN